MSCNAAIVPPLTLKNLVLLFRQEVDDLPVDATPVVDWQNDDSGLLWSNAEIVSYANQAITEFTRRKPIRDDSTASICEIALPISTTTVAYSSKILSIRRVRYTEDLSGDSLTLDKETVLRLDQVSDVWETDTGRPAKYLENSNERTVQIDRIPTVAGTLDLIVDRMPLTNLRWTHRHNDTPEIAEEHHMDLIYFMIHRAYMKRDSETFNQDASREYLGSFNSRVGAKPSAHLERVRREERNIRRRVKPHYF